MNTPDTEWTDAVEDIVRRIETLETDYSDGSYVSTSDAKKIGNDIHNLISSRDTYWKERVRKEVVVELQKIGCDLLPIAGRKKHNNAVLKISNAILSSLSKDALDNLK